MKTHLPYHAELIKRGGLALSNINMAMVYLTISRLHLMLMASNIHKNIANPRATNTRVHHTQTLANCKKNKKN